jgi:hypothetical protein
MLIQNQATYDMDFNGIPTAPMPNSSNIVEHHLNPDSDLAADLVADSKNPLNQTGDTGQQLLLITLMTIGVSGIVVAACRRRSTWKRK